MCMSPFEVKRSVVSTRLQPNESKIADEPTLLYFWASLKSYQKMKNTFSLTGWKLFKRRLQLFFDVSSLRNHHQILHFIRTKRKYTIQSNTFSLTSFKLFKRTFTDFFIRSFVSDKSSSDFTFHKDQNKVHTSSLQPLLSLNQ